MSNRKGLQKKSEEKAKFKGCVVDPNIGEDEIAWCSVVITTKGDNLHMTWTPYTRYNHDKTVDYAIKRADVNPAHVTKVEITKNKRLGKTMVTEAEEIIKWNLITN